MMKRLISFMLALTLLPMAWGCGKKAAAEPAFLELGAAAKPEEQVSELPDEATYAALLEFSYVTACKLLSEENGNYSPASLYFALALAASGAEGETKSELFSLLGFEQTDALLEECARLYNRLYQDTDVDRLMIANSLWLDTNVLGTDVAFHPNYLKNATQNFYASVFAADFSSAETAEAMSEWIFKNTKGKLKPEFQTSDEQVLSIVNTIYFYAEWASQFDEEKTEEDLFYLKDGKETSCSFLNETFPLHTFYIGEGYARAGLPLKNGGEMIFVLPDDGVDAACFLASADKLKDAFTGGEEKVGQVTIELPKFQIKSDFDLIPALKELGVEKAFGDSADFSNMVDLPVAITGVSQGTYIGIDEKGVEAAAYTKIDMAGTSCPDETAEFLDLILNRPFLYAVTSEDGVVLFLGICMDPAA